MFSSLGPAKSQPGCCSQLPYALLETQTDQWEHQPGRLRVLWPCHRSDIEATADSTLHALFDEDIHDSANAASKADTNYVQSMARGKGHAMPMPVNQTQSETSFMGKSQCPVTKLHEPKCLIQEPTFRWVFGSEGGGLSFRSPIPSTSPWASRQFPVRLAGAAARAAARHGVARTHRRGGLRDRRVAVQRAAARGGVPRGLPQARMRGSADSWGSLDGVLGFGNSWVFLKNSGFGWYAIWGILGCDRNRKRDLDA